jgi:hypothetical protein
MTTSSVAFERSTQPPDGKKVVTKATAKSTTVPLPNYVKHNESLKYPIAKVIAPTKASIEVQLTKPDSTTRQQYIQYRITDTFPVVPIPGMGGREGRWHHKDAVTSENRYSDLFTTPFTNLPSVTPFGNDVKISGGDAHGKSHTWVSCQNNFGDDDVTWIKPQQQCP